MMRAFWAALAGLAAALSTPVAAQDGAQAELETHDAEGEFDSPEATANLLDWLVGSWSGPGVRGITAMESWTAPVGGTMVGTFIQQNADGSIMFTELMYIRPVGPSLEIAIKHFSPDLTGWEKKDEVERFPLLALESCAAFFKTLTIRCADREKPGKSLVVAVRSGTDDDGKVKELVFRYRPNTGSSPSNYGCDGTTVAINQCLAEVRDRTKAREERYFDTALMENGAYAARVTEKERTMRDAQAAAEAERKAECGAVYDHWKEGTIRNAMALRCEIRLIDARTHTIWRNWLTFQDSTAPILPEPGPSR